MARNSAYAIYAAENDDTAELSLYGDICETQPYDYWRGQPAEGEFITLTQFLEDIKQIEGRKALNIRLSSYGGDAGVSNTIHNRLRELARNGTEITCTVDGVAMSGGSLIMCACDHVRVNPASIVMIHKCWSLVVGAYNADELREQAEQNDAWDKAQIEIYQRKTGLSKTVLDHMMSDTTYMTGREAVEKHFADELIEDEESVPISASADRSCIFANGRMMRLPRGVHAPDYLMVTPAPGKSTPRADDNKEPDEPGKGGTPMTLEELRTQYPDLVSEVEAGARASGTADAVKAERDRLAAIDEVAGLFDPELVREAKYGDKPLTAEQLAYQAAVKAAKNGQKFMAALDADNKDSGVQDVPADPAVDETAAPKTAAEKRDAAKKAVRDLLNPKGADSNG